MNATLDRLKADNVRLFVRGIRLDVDAPVGSLTPELTDWLRAHKTALIEAIELTGPCDRCRNPECVDIPIHNGASIRRDCSICGRTWGFPTWTPEIDRPPRFNVAAERHANAVAQADSVSANRKQEQQT